MKKLTTTSIMLLFLGVAFAQSHQQHIYSSSEDDIKVEWKDIEWTSTDIGDNRDKYYLNLSGTAPTVTISGGNNVTIEDGGSAYLNNNTNLVIGDAEGDTKTELRFTGVGKDTFLEMTGNSSLLIQKNGILTLEGGHTHRYWNPQTNGDDKDFFVVDGGTVNGNVGLGTTSGNAGFIRAVFKNGATMNRYGQVNPLGISGKAELYFDNSTYNVWSADYQNQNSGWGNHIINTQPDNQKLYATYTFTNGSVINGAGWVKDGEVTYFDFSTDMVREKEGFTQEVNGETKPINISGVGLTLMPARQTAEDGYFRFEVLNGAKISANGMNLGRNDGQNRNVAVKDADGNPLYYDKNYGTAASQITMGEVSFTMRGDSASNIAEFQGFGGTNLMGSRAVVGTEDSTFNMNFKMEGNAKYYTLGDFNIGTNQDTSGTINVDITGDNNTFRVNNMTIDAGSSATDLYVSKTEIVKYDGKDVANLISEEKFAGSTESININFGDGATNSSFTFGNMNIRQGKFSDINIKFGGDTNTFTTSGDINLNTSTVAGATAVTTFELATGGDITLSRNQRLFNNASGENYFIISNGTNATFNQANFTGSNVEGGTAKSYYIIDGSSLTLTSGCGYNPNNNQIKSGEMGFLLKGDGAKLISLKGFDVYPGNDGNVGGMFAVRMHGTNALMETHGDLNFSGKYQGEDAKYLLEILGSGNTLNARSNFNFGRQDSTAGTYTIYSKGDSATNKNQILFGTEEGTGGSGWALHGSANDAITNNAKVEIILAGNTVLKRKHGTNERVVINALEHNGMAYSSGNILFEVSGSGNEVYANNLKFGNAILTGGSATLRVVGGGSIIDATSFRVQAGDEITNITSFDAPVGGVLEFFVDDTGISTIKADGIDGALTGLLTVDFTKMKGNYEAERFVLISTKNSDLETRIANYWYDFLNYESLERMQIKGRELDDEYIEFAVEESELYEGYYDFVVYYSGTAIVPEPSTYAAILGALALGFAIYRRRK